jgi:cytochrome c551/c552
MTRGTFTLMLTAAVMLVTATMNAGGWAVVTVDDLPARIDAGRPLALAFTVRQHGMTPLSGLKASIEATSGSLKVAAQAVAAQKAGQYTATIVLASAGEWVVTIDSGFITSRLTLLPLIAVDPGAPAPVLSRADQGRQLFVAKGCVTCHANEVASSNTSLRLAQQLMPQKYQDELLSRILANPSATLPPRAEFPRMPDLNLQPGEISALVAFINSGNRPQTR